MVKNGRDSNFNEWINLAEFLHASKLKVTLIIIGLACVLLGHRILKSAIPQLKNKSMN